jgi:hypothetical protein
MFGFKVTLWAVPCAMCHVPCALCPVPCVLCPVSCALVAMLDLVMNSSRI